MKEQWQELKETITEMRDNDGIGTQQEVCKFLVNYMKILEKQMQESSEDCISRNSVIEEMEKRHAEGDYITKGFINSLPPVTSQESKWIPVSERFPDENSKSRGHGLCNVLVTHIRSGILCVNQAIFVNGEFHIYGNSTPCNTVIAWMPLPKPYEREREGQGVKKVYCTECPYFSDVIYEEEQWYGAECKKDGHSTMPSMYAIKSLNNSCPLRTESER